MVLFLGDHPIGKVMMYTTLDPVPQQPLHVNSIDLSSSSDAGRHGGKKYPDRLIGPWEKVRNLDAQKVKIVCTKTIYALNLSNDLSCPN
jgi:hypothetical protein